MNKKSGLMKYFWSALIVGSVSIISLYGVFVADTVIGGKKTALVNHGKNQWQTSINSSLEIIESGLNLAISSDEVDVTDIRDIHNWVINNAQVLKQNNNSSDYMVVGQSFDIEPLKVTDTIRSMDSDIPNILDEMNALVLSAKTLDAKMEAVEKAANKMSSIEGIPSEDIYYSMLGQMTIDHNITSSSSNSELFGKVMTDNKVDISKIQSMIKNPANEELWIASLLVPSGHLGFNNTTEITNGEINPSFKKIYIIVAIDADIIMGPVLNNIHQYNNILIAIVAILAVVIILCILAVIGLFVKVLNNNEGGEQIGDTGN